MRKIYIWAVSIVVLVGLAFAYWSVSTRAYSAENALEASYQRGFYNLQDQVGNIDLLLSKAMGTSSEPQQVMLLTSVWHLSEGARESLSAMPLGKQDMMSSQKFFAQLGDFSYNICRRIVLEEEISPEEWEQLRSFKKNTGSLSQELKNLNPSAIGRIKWEHRKTSGMAQNFANIEEQLKKEAPTITYDGPFSDHTENIQPKGIKGEKIDSQRAVDQATKYVSRISDAKYDVRVNNKVKGRIPAYNIYLTKPNTSSPEIIMDISETGGHLLWFLNTRRVEGEKLDVKQAVEKARQFLDALGFAGMEPTGSLRDDNTVTITFVPKLGEILLYPDYIKVQVALDNGEILGLDTVAYRTLHVERSLPEARISEEEALETLKKSLKVSRVRKALIPTPSHSEKLCYEVDATLEDERFFIYINVETGQEQEILKIVETDRGTMTM